MSKILSAAERVGIFNEAVKREEAEWLESLQTTNGWMDYECRLYRTYNYDDMSKRYGDEHVHKDMDARRVPRTIEEPTTTPEGS